LPREMFQYGLQNNAPYLSLNYKIAIEIG
jgi:hypothetical protein